MGQDADKQAAAQAALVYLRNGCKLGVGTGTTVEFFIALLGSAPEPEAVVASSQRSAELLTAQGFSLSDLNAVGRLDLYVDGADEFTERYTLIKGGGGAHTREKILAMAANKFVVIADATKQVEVLGKFPIALEVLPMARGLVAGKIAALGGSAAWRVGFTTDEGNHILDCSGLDCTDSAGLESRLCALPGVVDCGVCAQRPADVILCADNGAVSELVR